MKVFALVVVVSLCACKSSVDGGDSNTDDNPVLNGGHGAATLHWNAPTQNTDGSALTDLDHYVVYFGNESESYSTAQSEDVPLSACNDSECSYVVDGLGAGAWYFVVTAVNADGVASAYSGEVSKIL